MPIFSQEAQALGTLKISVAQGNERRPTASLLNRRAGLFGRVLGLFDGKTVNDFRPRECGEESIGDKELRAAQPRADAGPAFGAA